MLYLHHSNSLIKLAGILKQALSERRLEVLQREFILVQNPGMKRWLQQQLSACDGIAANIHFPLPSRFIWDIFSSQFELADRQASYDAEALRWSLMSILKQHKDDPPLAQLKPYLQQDDNHLKTFQLAEKLAALFDQYQIYRPQMISRWDNNRAPQSGVEGWQCYLWSRVREKLQQPHRAQLLGELIHHLKSNTSNIERLPRRVSVFAISAMSPLYVQVLLALAEHTDVNIYILNPCQYYWGDIKSRKELVNEYSAEQAQEPTDNELLASLGRQGKEFIDQFYDDIEPPSENPQFVEIVPDTVLTKIQYDILNLNLNPASSNFSYQDDKSIQVVTCYSELRELQVLHDRLLQLMQKDETLQPHDIVVMCPDVNTLAPYVEAVFSVQPENKKIPFSISDNSELAVSPLVQAVIDWLNLPRSRFSASEIMSWLELPALQRAYQFEEKDIEVIRYWINATQIHWGKDRSHKKQLSLGDNDLNTWSHGFGRLLSAYLMHEDCTSFGEQLPSQVILSTAELYCLGQLQKLLDDLESWSRRLSRPNTLNEWQNQINSLMESFLALDDEEEWLLKQVRDVFSDWQKQAAVVSFDEPLDASLIANILQNELQKSYAGHRYLGGAINFCNLIPMRTLPFRVVCLVGLGDDRFPRAETPLNIDLISRSPRKGDRSRREDDRYMFLQSILSAQEYLYISYVGRSKKDDSVIEPSVVVVELLDQVLDCCGVKIEIEKMSLQPFSFKNYQAGSYAELWQVENLVEPVPFDQVVENSDLDKSIALEDFISFFKNPSRFYMQEKLNLNLTEYDSESDDDEIFTLDPLNRYVIRSELMDDLLTDGEIDDFKYLRSGSLAQQNCGVLQLQQQREDINPQYQKLLNHEHYQGECSFHAAVTLEQGLLSGRIFSYSDTGLLRFSLSKCKGSSLFPLWIEYCVLCANGLARFGAFSFSDTDIYLEELSALQAQKYLEVMLSIFSQGNQRLLPLYMDSAFEYEKKKRKEGDDAARLKVAELWSGNSFSPFYEAEDSYVLTALKNKTEWPEEFYRLASGVMEPLFNSMESSS